MKYLYVGKASRMAHGPFPKRKSKFEGDANLFKRYVVEDEVKTTPPPADYTFWLGAEGEKLGKTFYMNLKGYQ